MPRAKERSPKKIARELENHALHLAKVGSGGLSRAERRELVKMGVPVATTFMYLTGEKERKDEAIRLRGVLRKHKARLNLTDELATNKETTNAQE